MGKYYVKKPVMGVKIFTYTLARGDLKFYLQITEDTNIPLRTYCNIRKHVNNHLKFKFRERKDNILSYHTFIRIELYSQFP